MSTIEFPVTITETAVARIKRLIERDGRPNAFLRIGVKGGGCTGFEYVTQVEDTPRENDMIAEYDGVVVRCDPKSATFLEGSILDQSDLKGLVCFRIFRTDRRMHLGFCSLGRCQ